MEQIIIIVQQVYNDALPPPVVKDVTGHPYEAYYAQHLPCDDQTERVGRRQVILSNTYESSSILRVMARATLICVPVDREPNGHGVIRAERRRLVLQNAARELLLTKISSHAYAE